MQQLGYRSAECSTGPPKAPGRLLKKLLQVLYLLMCLNQQFTSLAEVTLALIKKFV